MMDYNQALEAYSDYLKKNYAESQTANYNQSFDVLFEDMVLFTKVTTVSFGAKNVHSFVVKEQHELKDGAGNTKIFYLGDILAAADYHTPKLVPTCGNIITQDYKNIRWSLAGTSSRRKPKMNLVSG